MKTQIWILLCMTLQARRGNSQHQNRFRVMDSFQSRPFMGAPTSEWGEWGEWSECSRTCGGGVQEQRRTCRKLAASLDRPLDGREGCVGGNKLHRPCSPIPCPDGTVNTRNALCAQYNSRLFAGNTYVWEPMNRGGPCQLSCRAKGHRFFVRHALKVTDGTDCSYSTLTTRERTYLGGLQAGHSKHMCVDGRCLKIGCDGRIGSGAAIDKCGVCGGNMEICRYVNGIFRTPHLTHDFHTVVIIPAGAGRINITETRNSRSCIALRSARNPSVMFINGKLKLGVLDHSGRYNVAGTQFEYNRPRFTNKGETMIATGPTNEDLEVLLFFQQENPGITYEYTIPKRNAQLPSIVGTTEPRGSSSLNGRNANERFDLSTTRDASDQSSPTTYTGGHYPGGTSTHSLYRSNGYRNMPPVNRGRGSRYYRKNYRNRITDAEAVDREDSSNSRRDITTVHRLNPPLLSGEPNPMGRTKWMKVGFGPCSQSCAEGTKSSNIKCIRLSTRKPVSDEYCTGQQKPRKQVRRCNRQACPAYYDVGDWLECSRTCGSGRRTRTVICRQLFSGNFTSAVSHNRCRGLSKPPSHERCLVRVCAHWAPAQEWSPCSSRCGAGTQSRHSVCKSGDGRILPNRECGSQRRPATMRTCDAGPCLTKWFITDWQQCSADCDRGQQRRNVVCINTANVPAGCPRRHQPEASRNCARSSCGVKHEWFAGKWGSCSSNCGRGIQTRKATCLSVATDGTMSVAPETNNRFPCEISEKPALQRPCNTQSCGSRWHYTQWTECSVSCGGGSRTRDVHCLDEAGLFSPLCKASHKPKAAETCNTISCFALRDPNCEDKRSDCEQLKRARLCKYKVFRDDCCATCPNPDSTHTSSLHGR